MYKRGRKLGVGGICLAIALSLAAFSSPSAQANWKVGGAEVKEGTEVPLALTVHLNPKLLFRVPGIGIVIHCDRLLFHSKISFPRVWRSKWLIDINCRILSGEKEVPCKMAEPVEASTKGELFLHEGKTYLRVEPETAGAPFMTMKFSGEECVLPKEVVVKGKLVLEDPSLETEQVEHVFTPNNKGLFADKLLFGASEAKFEGEMGVTLGEGFEGKKWSGVA
ncbi:MAG TPA: hypothetical protein VN758_03390 [Solirubrobacterales bacterium]|nr:hypothetical protein [Solirubrobacterales bacterium]